MLSAFWFRRDLRIHDNPALLNAISESSEIICFVTADQVGQAFDDLSEVRKNSLRSSWVSLSSSIKNRLVILKSPSQIPALLTENKVTSLYLSEAYDTHGRAETRAISADLFDSGIRVVIGKGAYLVPPGEILKDNGTPYRVFTPYYKQWMLRSFEKPYPAIDVSKVKFTEFDARFDFQLHLGFGVKTGEDFARKTISRFISERIANYGLLRDRPDTGGTSHISHALSHGEIHPRTILNLLPTGSGAEAFLRELAWREFYADVLYHNPHSLNEYLDSRFATMEYNYPGPSFEAWKLGRTGFPMVDAGMRQLAETGWMHNRVRMIVASFLVKDLHIEWQHGAKWFEENLTDYDPASNSHGWQWTAGCGTDAAPFFRVFNPISQGLKFDPDGTYVRRFIPELRHLKGASAHEPWLDESGYQGGYSMRIVDHSVERVEALRRYSVMKEI